MKFTTYIVDDEPHAIELLTRYVEATRCLKLSGTTLDAQQALNVLQGLDPPMLVFSDIDMPVLSGIKLAGYCQKGTRIVFTTSYREYGPEAFEQNASDYLLKPFSYERFLDAVAKVTDALNRVSVSGDVLFVRGGQRHQWIRIRLDDVLFVEGAENFIYIHTVKERQLVYSTMSAFQEMLPPGFLVQVHKSYMVRISRVAAVEPGELLMDNGKVVPIGRAFTEVLRGAIGRQTF